MKLPRAHSAFGALGLTAAFVISACGPKFEANSRDEAAGGEAGRAGSSGRTGSSGTGGSATAGETSEPTAGSGGGRAGSGSENGGRAGDTSGDAGEGNTNGSGATGGVGAMGGVSATGGMGGVGAMGGVSATGGVNAVGGSLAGAGGATGGSTLTGGAGPVGGTAGFGGTAASGGTVTTAGASGSGGKGGSGGTAGSSSCAALTIDDMEDGDRLTCPKQGSSGDWWTATGTLTGSISPATNQNFSAFALGPDARPGSSYGMRLAGQGFGQLETDWASLGFYPAGIGPHTLEPYQGLAFYAKSKGAAIKLHVKFATDPTTPVSSEGSCQQDCNDHYRSVVELDSTWRQFSLPFADLTQEGWGPKPKDLGHYHFIYFGFLGTDMGPAAFEFLIDDVRFY